MAEIEEKTKRYPTDLTDEEWARIEPFLPVAAKSGRPGRTVLREVLNAIRYLARSGGGWRMLPSFSGCLHLPAAPRNISATRRDAPANPSAQTHDTS
jgi:transposase